MLKRYLYILFFVWLVKPANAVCPQVYDYLGNLSSHPYWVSCTGGAYTLNFQSNTSWGAYTINWGDGTASFSSGAYGANTIITHPYTATIDTFIVTVTIPGNTCVMTGVVVMEKPVNASIQIPIGGVTTICAPKAILFSNSSTDVSETTNFTWDFGDGSPIVAYTYTNVGQTISHTYNKGTVNCQTAVTLKAKNYCTTVPTIAVFNPIQVYDVDIAAITPSAFVKCWPDNAFTFNNTTSRNCVPQGNTFQRQEYWNFGNYWGLGHDSIINWKPWPPTLPHVVAYPAVGSYSVQLKDSNLCGVDTKTIVVSIVNPPVAGIISPSIALCQGVAVTFTNASATGYIYKWNFGDGGGFITKPFGQQSYIYNSAGMYTVSIVALIGGGGASCTDTEKVVVTILPSPIANFSVSPNFGCNKLIGATFTDGSTNATQWNWNFGNGNTFTGQIPPLQNYITPGLFVPTLTVTGVNTCKNTFTTVVNVYTKPTAIFSPSAACVLAAVNFTDASTFGVTEPILSWAWNFGDASATVTNVAQNPTHTYSTQNTYTVQLIINTAHCQDTTEQTILINVKPQASFTFAPINGCPTLSVNFTNTSINGTSYNWNLGNTTTSTNTNVVAIYTNTTTANLDYTVTLTAGTGLGCVDTQTALVTVFPKPKSVFTTNALAGCSPVAATFTNSSVGALTYTWNFGDNTSSGTTATAFSHTYTNSTLLIQTYTVQLLATSNNGCKDSSQLIVTAYPRPIFNFTMIPASGCTPLSINFPAVLGAVSYTWDYGDGSPSTFGVNPIHTFTNNTTNNQTYTVQLIASNAFSCIDTTYGYPIVYPKPIASYNISPPNGCSPLAVNFTNTSLVGFNYLWKFGDTQTDNLFNTTHTYTNTSNTANKTFTSTLVAISVNGCRDSVTNVLTTFFKPKVNFTVDTPSCSPKLLNFVNTSIGAQSHQWSFGTSNATSINATHSFINNTTATITQTVQLVSTSINNCTDTLVVPINVYPKPEFTIIAQPDSGCTPLQVCFPKINGVTNYQWQFGDGNAATTASVCNTYFNNSQTNKTYTVQLIATNGYGCKDTSVKNIKVFAQPIALFQANPTTVFVPTDPVTCSNLSSGATTYNWNFGDANESTDVNPVHTYLQAGNFQITLIATNLKGCKDTFELPAKIVAVLESDIDVPNAFSPNQTGGNGGIFGVNDSNNDVFHPVLRGVSKYELNIFSRWGELLFVSKDVLIGWDGYYKGKLCTQDVYVWKIIATTIDGKRLNKTGDLLLLR
jgi:gliding motility-associated-like protein